MLVASKYTSRNDASLRCVAGWKIAKMRNKPQYNSLQLCVDRHFKSHG